MIKNSLSLCLLFILFFSTQSIAQEDPEATDSSQSEETLKEEVSNNPQRFFNRAVVQGLNKTTAKTSTIEMRVGEKIRFGQISITALKCWQAPLDQKPESKILIEVLESKNNEPEKRIFYGWIFASSPSVSGLEHPIYDLTAIGCKVSSN